MDDLKAEINAYNMVSKQNINKISSKEELLELLNLLKTNETNKINYDYNKFVLDGKVVHVSDEQYKIVIANINENIRVIACPGSGKTTTLVARLKYLLDCGINPSTILVATFNVDASDSMKKKIMQIFGFMPKINIGTIDSIACKFYHTYFKKNYYVGVSEYTTYLLQFLKSDNKHQILDQYKYVLFDEFQDVNDIQFEIIKVFNNNGAIVTVIGDDAQSIYSWRGSNIDYILNFDKYIQNTTTYKLKKNFRSTPEIVDFCNNSIKHNTDQIPKEMISMRTSIGFRP